MGSRSWKHFAGGIAVSAANGLTQALCGGVLRDYMVQSI
jgi:hypothetical protein